MPVAVLDQSRRFVIAVKCASFRYTPKAELISLLKDFRSMCNDAIRLAVRGKPTSRFKLIELAYQDLKRYGLHTHYILSACEVAYAAYKSPNRKSVPNVRNCFLKLDNQSYRLNHLLLRMPTTSRSYVFLVLQGSDHHLALIDDLSLKKGSITVTDRTVSIAFSKKVEPFQPVGAIGIDVNERNVTVSANGGYDHHFNGLGEVVVLKERYREIRGKIHRLSRGDRRIAAQLLGKYGRREKDRTESQLHEVTRQIVDYAVEHKLGIKMEKLKGIRKLYRKGNGQSRSFRGRMNTWVFGETQRQIDYKSRWDGVPVWYVNPRGTSSYCLCGSRVVPLADRKLFCPKCDRTWDRDDLASKNIMACVVPQDRPSRGSNEGGRGDDGSNPPSRCGEGRS